MSVVSKLRHLWRLPWLEKTQSVAGFYWSLKSQLYYRLFFGHIGRKSKLIAPMQLKNVHNIRIGDDVLINKYSFLFTWAPPEAKAPCITIGDGSVIGHMNHITCLDEVIIGKQVLTADRVYISDHSHGFSDITVPIMKQPSVSKGTVKIGDGTWLGENVVVLCCKIGKNCVIGANSVVLSDVPDYCVAVGAPARVVRNLNPISRVREEAVSER